MFKPCINRDFIMLAVPVVLLALSLSIPSAMASSCFNLSRIEPVLQRANPDASNLNNILNRVLKAQDQKTINAFLELSEPSFWNQYPYSQDAYRP